MKIRVDCGFVGDLEMVGFEVFFDEDFLVCMNV